MPELNQTDIQILDALQRDGSLTTQEVADKINISQSPCWRRINRLEEKHFIERKVALLNRERLGMEVVVFATVNLTTQGRDKLELFEQEVEVLPEVMECYTMAGTWDYMLKIVVKDIRALCTRKANPLITYWRGSFAHCGHGNQKYDGSTTRFSNLNPQRWHHDLATG